MTLEPKLSAFEAAPVESGAHAEKDAPSASFVPVASEERLLVLDVLRGFALLGIMIMNMPGFSLPSGVGALEPRLYPGVADRMAELFMNTFFSGKANSIFSFLFGLGLTIQIQRAQARGQTVGRMYARRLLVLFVVGVAHSFLLWNGDVLHHYALLGLLLLPLSRASNRWVFGLMVVCLLFPIARDVYAVVTNEPPVHTLAERAARAYEQLRVFQSGSYGEQLAVRVEENVEFYALSARLGGAVIWYMMLTLTMLLGFYAGRQRLLVDVTASSARIRTLMVWCFGLGLGCAATAAAMGWIIGPQQGPTLAGLLRGISYELNRPLLCIAYICAVAMLVHKPRFRGLAEVFAAPGRMPLTNYLMQTVIATTIFYSYGFGRFGQVGPLAGLLLSVSIFAVQVMYSRYWVARFQYGPLEWLWRVSAYGKPPPMRVAAKTTA